MTRSGVVSGRRTVAVATALSLALTPAAPLLAGPAPLQAAAAAPAATKPAAKAVPAKAATAAPAPVDGGWPRAYTTPSGGRVVLYQPQVASWADQRHAVAYAAVSYEAKGASKPALGSLKVEADTKVSVSERLVNFSVLQVTESNFPTLKKEEVRDGEAIWSPIKDNDLKFAVNTNWDLFQHEPTKTFYLPNEKAWLKATVLAGAWSPAGQLPGSFTKLPADENWKDVKAALPGQKLAAASVPRVFVSTTPAELILLSGPPKYEPVTGTSLLWVSNTESDVFRVGKAGPVYYLVSGRWFTSPGFEGPWTFGTLKLPADFQKISLEHPRSRVLAAVPGTQQAAEAVLLAQVPQTARVNKKELKAPEVAYQGEGKFEPIEKTTVSQAVNTDKDIIKVGDLYYMCFQGVWFVSKAPTGSWEVTSSVPKEIYEIPVSSSAHDVTYVTVVEDDDVYGSWGSTSVQRGDQWAQTSRVTSNRTGDTARVTRGSGGGTAVTKRGPGADSGVVRTGQRRRLCRPRRQRLSQRRRQLAEVRQRLVGRRGPARWAGGHDAGPGPRERGFAARDARPQHDGRWLRRWMGLRHEGPAQPRLAGALRRRAAHARLQQLPAQQRQPQQREHVPAERGITRRRRAWRWRPAPRARGGTRSSPEVMR
jgi:hypothetical protein